MSVALAPQEPCSIAVRLLWVPLSSASPTRTTDELTAQVVHESIDMVTVKAAYGGILEVNGDAVVEAKVYAYSSTNDLVDFYYNAGNVTVPD